MRLLYIIAIILIALWLMGLILNFAGGMIHFVLVIAIILIILEATRAPRI